MTLNGKRILIVEDEFVVAIDLADEVIASGGTVIEAVGSVDAALDIIATTDLDGAVLDIKLRGQTAFLVADALAARHIPFVIESGYVRPCEAPTRHANVPWLEKPCSPGAVCHALDDVISPRRKATRAPSKS
jgi:CheY-like chemotaxis protein